MMNDEARRCPHCGTPVVADDDVQFCPTCLLELALGEMHLPHPHPIPASDGGHPDHIGPYRVLSILGEGGMGIVYLAEQDRPVRRRVALKVIKRGMDTNEVIARFESERQALALMNHPNIARVLDAGSTPEGRPYFAMEYVEGVPITAYCDAHRLGTPERLGLFLTVTEAVQHAHQKGIIHRDIKPSNVLVAAGDDGPVPKVIDFGVAKATNQRLTEKTLYTEMGVVIGTPEYMSPEQADQSAEGVDTRTDVYSLGVLLYELLVGVLPFDTTTLREAAFAEMQRIIREDDPQRLATRLLTLGDRATAVARNRRTNPTTLRRLVSGDLDWITQQALAKERSRRYQSVSELGRDIQRHLEHEPVMASPPGLAYRLGKFVRRHRVPVAAGAVVILTFATLGTLAMVLGLQVQRRGEQVRSNSIVASAAAADDPVVGALLLLETEGLPDPEHRLAVARQIADQPLPTAVLEVPEWLDGALSPDGGLLAVAGVDGSVTVVPTDGRSPSTMHDTGSAAPVIDVEFSPDGRTLAGGSADGTLTIWSVDGSGEPMRLVGHREMVWTVAFSPDGAYLASAGGKMNLPTVQRSEDPTIRLWRLDGTEPGRVVGRHDAGVSKIAFSPDGRLIVSGSYDRTVRIWSVIGAAPPIVLRGHQHIINDVAFSPDSTRVVSGSSDTTVRVWTVDGAGEPTVLASHRAPVVEVAFTPTGSNILSAAGNPLAPGSRLGNEALLWRLDGAGDPVAFTGHEAALSGLDITADSDWIVTTAMDGTARLHPTAQIQLRGPPAPIVFRGPVGRSLPFLSRDGRTFVHLRNDGSASVFDLRSLSEARTLVAPAGHQYTAYDLTADGDLLALGVSPIDPAAPAYVSLRRADTFEEIRRLEGHVERIVATRFSKDGTRLVSTGWDTTARVYGVDDGREVAVLAGHPPDSIRVDVSPDGRHVVTGGADGRLRLFDLSAPDTPEVRLTREDRYILKAVFTGDGSELLTVVDIDGVYFWPRQGGAPRTLMSGPVKGAALNPDETLVAVTGTDGRVRVVRRSDGTEVSSFPAHSGMLSNPSFSPDGEQVLTYLAEDIRVWRLDGSEALAIRVPGERVAAAGFAPDGRSIVGVTATGARIWRATWADLRSYFRERVTSCLSATRRVRFLGETPDVARAAEAACRAR